MGNIELNRYHLFSLSLVMLMVVACGGPSGTAVPPTNVPTRAPISVPTLPPSTAVAPTLPPSASAPTLALPPTTTPTTPPDMAALTAELSQLVAPQLPPTSTPDASGSAFSTGFTGINILPLNAPNFATPLWVAYTYGIRSFDPLRNHFVEIYTHAATGWQQLAQIELENPDYVDQTGLTQVSIDSSHIWLEVESGAGAHGGCFDLLMFDGQALGDEVSSCAGSPGAGSVADVNGDGQPDVVLDQTDAYVFCYACGVRQPDFRVMRWDGQQFIEVTLTKLPDSAPDALRQPTNRAVDLAMAGLWMEAKDNIDLAISANVPDDTASWDSALIQLHVSALQDQVGNGAYPLLDQLFYGDYTAALNVMRAYTPEELFSPDTPLVKGTVAEGWEQELSDRVVGLTTAALQVEPNLAPAYFLRGWAKRLIAPNNGDAIADIQKAAQLDPAETLYSESLTYLGH